MKLEENSVSEVKSLRLTQQLQIAISKTMAGSQTTPDSIQLRL